MKIPTPEEVDARVRKEMHLVALLNDLQSQYQELNHLRDEAHISRGDEIIESFDLVVDAVHDSLAIEGLATLRQETRRQLEECANAIQEGKVHSGSQVANLYRALLRLGNFVGAGQHPNNASIRELHSLLMGPTTGPVYSPAGTWRRENNVIRNSEWITPAWEEVPQAMEAFEHLLIGCFDSLHPIVVAAWTHLVLTEIHPFMDGNGRVARLVQDHILWGRSATPGIIPADALRAYYGALAAGDKGDPVPLTALVGAAAQSSAARQINTYRAKRRRTQWATDLARKVEESAQAIQERAYHRWRARMEDVRDAFEAGAEALASANIPVEIQYRQFDILSFELWQSLRTVGRTSPNWFFTVSFFHRTSVGSPFITYIYSFGRHYVEERDPQEDRETGVALKLSMKDAQAPSRVDLEYDDYTIARPRLRQIYFNNHRLCARLTEASAGTWSRAADCDADDLARGFYVDVLADKFRLPI